MQVLSAIFPILLISIIGYLAARKGLVSSKETDGISKFTFTLAVPALLFISTTRVNIPDFAVWDFIFSFYAGVIIVFLCGIVLAKHIFHYDHASQSVFGVSAAYSNTTIVGIPVCLQTLGPDSMLPLFIIISIQNLFIFFIGIMAAEREDFRLSRTLSYLKNMAYKLIKSPITLSLILGISFNLLNIKIVTPVEKSLELFAQSAIPAALFVLGASLTQFRLTSNLRETLTLVALKNILLPAVVYVFSFHIFAIDKLWASTAIIAAAMPIGISAYIFSQKYHSCNTQVASSILLSTTLSFVTVGLILMQLNMVRL